MELKFEQVSAATACGCGLAPATEDQVGRLSMQRRVFTVDGKPFVVARNGFFETHGSHEALIANRRPDATSDRGDDAGEAPVLNSAPSLGPEASPSEVAPAAPVTVTAHVVEPPSCAPEMAPPEQKLPRRVASKRRSGKTTVAASAEPAVEAPQGLAETEPADAPPPEASATSAVGAMHEDTNEPAAVARTSVRPRSGQPSPPRWKIAGKLRRGRPT